MQQLSGGQKSLVALGMIFAVSVVRGVPHRHLLAVEFISTTPL